MKEVIKQTNFRKINQEINEATVSFPNHPDRDNRRNRSLLFNRECPECLYHGGIIWHNPRVTIALGDAEVTAFWLTNLPEPEDEVTCQMCGYTDEFVTWGPWEELSDKHPGIFNEGDVVSCLRRRKGTNRKFIQDLWKFEAKRGVQDKVVRWCMVKPVLVEDVNCEGTARQMSRFLGLQYHARSLSHRQEVKTIQSMAIDAMTSL